MRIKNNPYFQSSNFGPLKKHLGKLCGINTDKIYLNHIHQLFIAIFKDHQHETYKEHMDENSSNNFSTFDEPYLELFLWAVLTNKWILVDYFWPRLQTPLLGALIAGSICSKLAHVNKADKSSDYKGLSTRKIKFQTIASEIIEKAFLNDQSKAFSLLDLRNPRWGDKNLLNISHIGYLRAFVASKFSSQCSLNLYTYMCIVYLDFFHRSILSTVHKERMEKRFCQTPSTDKYDWSVHTYDCVDTIGRIPTRIG